jgi:hypothetical protein
MARKKGDERKSSTSEYTSSHSPASAASVTCAEKAQLYLNHFTTAAGNKVMPTKAADRAGAVEPRRWRGEARGVRRTGSEAGSSAATRSAMSCRFSWYTGATSVLRRCPRSVRAATCEAKAWGVTLACLRRYAATSGTKLESDPLMRCWMLTWRILPLISSVFSP